MADQVSSRDVINFRLAAQGLAERVGQDGVLEMAGRCGVQDSPPGSALLALHARVRGLMTEQVFEAVAGERSLLKSWCMRGAPFYFPTADAPVFTTGVLPPTDDAMLHLVRGVEPALKRLDLSLSQAVDLTDAELDDVLTGRHLAISELGTELAERIGPELPRTQRVLWEQVGPYAVGQPLGEAVVHFCLRILTLRRRVCFAPREGNQAPFVLVDEWVGHPIPDMDPGAARAELLRRYLRCYGPSTRDDFAGWVGVATQDADHWWNLLGDEVVPVDFRGTTWLLAEDVAALGAAPTPHGARLLPPRDPYTQLRDRETIVATRFHPEVWKKAGDPGAVLADGEIVGTWRPRKAGRRLTVSVKTFGSLAARHRALLQDEADRVALLRGAASVQVELQTY